MCSVRATGSSVGFLELSSLSQWSMSLYYFVLAARVAVLYENKDYCKPDTCRSQEDRKGWWERSKDYWRSKFGKCQGPCRDHGADEERCLAAISYTSKDTVDVSNSSRSYQLVYDFIFHRGKDGAIWFS